MSEDWTDEQIRQINAEMAAEIINEIGEVLEHVGCDCEGDMLATPPMFYPEAIICAIHHAFDEGRRFERERDQ